MKCFCLFKTLIIISLPEFHLNTSSNSLSDIFLCNQLVCSKQSRRTMKFIVAFFIANSCSQFHFILGRKNISFLIITYFLNVVFECMEFYEDSLTFGNDCCIPVKDLLFKYKLLN